MKITYVSNDKIVDHQESEYYYIVQTCGINNDLYLQYSHNGYSFGSLVTAIQFTTIRKSLNCLDLLLKIHNSINKESLCIMKIKTTQEKEKICTFVKNDI